MLPRIASYTLDTDAFPTNSTEWLPDPSRAALLVHDMQNHFVDAFDPHPESQIKRAIGNIDLLSQFARQEDMPLIYTAQPPAQQPQDRQLLNDFWGSGMQSAQGAQIIQQLAPRPEDTVLTKWRYCAFYRTDLDHRLRNYGKDQLWITGIYSHIGCLTTALTAFMKGYKVFFIGDAQADFSREEHQMALSYVAQRCGQTIQSARILKS
ncbi:isochorismatase family protein [Rothia sp. CCM 9416]|uniref:isochorismatase family protein n=1 Tax=Rothia sp. CCM 9416 TaxID=3402655 RepID=UPI003AD84257